MPDLNGFTEVTILATGEVTSVPADWLDPSFPDSGKFEKTLAQKVIDGDVPAEVASDVPTEKDKVADIEAYADKMGIDLSGASNKAEKLAAVQAAAPATSPATDTGYSRPDVQTVLGESSTESTIPAVRDALRAAEADPDDTGSSAETPSAGE